MSAEAPKTLAVIITASPGESDVKYAEEIGKQLDRFGVKHTRRVGSAHKDPEYVIRRIMHRYDMLMDYKVVYITHAGRSDGLSHVVDAATTNPVVAAPPYSDKYAGVDIFSSLRPPGDVGPVVASTAEIAAIHAAKILGLFDSEIAHKVAEMHRAGKNRVMEADFKLEESENLG